MDALTPPADPAETPAAAHLAAKIAARKAKVGVIGLGYVGLPLAVAAARAGFATTGFDIDPKKPDAIAAGESYISSVSDKALKAVVGSGMFSATDNMWALGECDVIAICVPTPLTPQRAPDLRFVEATVRAIGNAHRANAGTSQLVVLESTTYPGTTEEVVLPILQAAGAVHGESLFLAYSPEREDPGRTSHSTETIPKIVAGYDRSATVLVRAFYGAVVENVVPVSSLKAAEAVKLYENIFRAVNIALVNEAKLTFDAMGIDIWEVVEAAGTKPFGFMPFYPGPGLGGHCIPIDPFYLTWKAREFGETTRFVELAGEINWAMPGHVVQRLAIALDEGRGRGLQYANILVVGAAYKKNVSDVRESPALRLMSLLRARGSRVAYHDPLVPTIPPTREYGELEGMTSVALDDDALRRAEAVLIVTDHDDVDYARIGRCASLIVDTRNAMRRHGAEVKGRLVLA